MMASESATSTPIPKPKRRSTSGDRIMLALAVNFFAIAIAVMGDAVIRYAEGGSFAGSWLAGLFQGAQTSEFEAVQTVRGLLEGVVWAVWILLAGLLIWKFRWLMGKVEFALLTLVFFAAGSLLGTLVIQNLNATEVTETYGEVFALPIVGDLLQGLFEIFDLLNIYNAKWFGALIILLVMSIASVMLSRPKTKRWLGFHMTHIGLIIVGVGGFTSYFFAEKGRIDLLEGQPFATQGFMLDKGGRVIVDKIDRFNADGNLETVDEPRTFQLGFEVGLERFIATRYEPEHKLYVYQRRPHPRQEAQDEFILRQVLPLIDEKGQVNRERFGEAIRIYGTDFYLRMNEYYGNVQFDGLIDDPDAFRQPALHFDLVSGASSETKLLLDQPRANLHLADSQGGIDVIFQWETTQVPAVGDILDNLPSPHVLYVTTQSDSFPPSLLEVGEEISFDRRIGLKLVSVYPDYTPDQANPLQPASALASDAAWQNPVARLRFVLYRDGQSEGTSNPAADLLLSTDPSNPYAEPNLEAGEAYEAQTGMIIRYDYREVRYVVLGQAGQIAEVHDSRVVALHPLVQNQVLEAHRRDLTQSYSFRGSFERPTPSYRELDTTMASPALALSLLHADDPDFQEDFLLMEASQDHIFLPLEPDEDASPREMLEHAIKTNMQGENHEPGMILLPSARDAMFEMFESKLVFRQRDGTGAIIDQERASISVNYPHRYRGWDFFQVEFNPQRPDYSGIIVTRDPGEPIFYVGMLLTLFGAIMMFFIKPFKLIKD